MTRDVAVLIRNVYHEVDADQQPLTVDEVMHRAGPVRPLDVAEGSARSPWLPAMAAIVAVVVVVVVAVALLSGTEVGAPPATDPDSPPTTAASTVPDTPEPVTSGFVPLGAGPQLDPVDATIGLPNVWWVGFEGPTSGLEPDCAASVGRLSDGRYAVDWDCTDIRWISDDGVHWTEEVVGPDAEAIPQTPSCSPADGGCDVRVSGTSELDAGITVRTSIEPSGQVTWDLAGDGITGPTDWLPFGDFDRCLAPDVCNEIDVVSLPGAVGEILHWTVGYRPVEGLVTGAGADPRRLLWIGVFADDPPAVDDLRLEPIPTPDSNGLAATADAALSEPTDFNVETPAELLGTPLDGLTWHSFRVPFGCGVGAAWTEPAGGYGLWVCEEAWRSEDGRSWTRDTDRDPEDRVPDWVHGTDDADPPPADVTERFDLGWLRARDAADFGGDPTVELSVDGESWVMVAGPWGTGIDRPTITSGAPRAAGEIVWWSYISSAGSEVVWIGTFGA